MDRVRKMPGVMYAEPDYYYHIDVIPTDFHWPNQWGMAKVSAPLVSLGIA